MNFLVCSNLLLHQLLKDTHDLSTLLFSCLIVNAFYKFEMENFSKQCTHRTVKTQIPMVSWFFSTPLLKDGDCKGRFHFLRYYTILTLVLLFLVYFVFAIHNNIQPMDCILSAWPKFRIYCLWVNSGNWSVMSISWLTKFFLYNVPLITSK